MIERSERTLDNETKTGEYLTKGDYHKNLDKKWAYYPIYICKMEIIKKYLDSLPKGTKVLDAGCGEGVLVQEYAKKLDIKGLDLHYASHHVTKGSITNMPFSDETFDVVLALDILEHINYEEQKPALDEIRRVLKKDGTFLCSIPNLSHFASRISFLFTGNLLRTSTIDRHKGDRSYPEFRKLMQSRFNIVKTKGLFPTFPIISFLTIKIPSKVVWLHRIENYLFGSMHLCFQNIYWGKKI